LPSAGLTLCQRLYERSAQIAQPGWFAQHLIDMRRTSMAKIRIGGSEFL
jgi:hypothetical protein